MNAHRTLLSGSLQQRTCDNVEAELFGAHGRFVGTIHQTTTLEAEGRAAVLAQDDCRC
jgi:hypothetical protein